MIIFNIKKKQFDDAQQEYINPFYDKKLITLVDDKINFLDNLKKQ